MSSDHDLEQRLERLRVFYQKSWGNSWPTHEVVADIPTDESDDVTASDSDDDDSDKAMPDTVSQVFTVYDDMEEVASALEMDTLLPALVIREIAASRQGGQTCCASLCHSWSHLYAESAVRHDN